MCSYRVLHRTAPLRSLNQNLILILILTLILTLNLILNMISNQNPSPNPYKPPISKSKHTPASPPSLL